MTLRQRLFKDKEMVRSGQSKLHFGKNYYSRLRALYAEDSGLDGMLALGSEQPEPRLYSSFKSLLRHPPVRTDIILWCERARSLSKTSIKLLCQALRRFSHNGCREQLDSALVIMGCLANYPDQDCKEIYHAMKPRFDTFLTQVRHRGLLGLSSCWFPTLRKNRLLSPSQFSHTREKNNCSPVGP